MSRSSAEIAVRVTGLGKRYRIGRGRRRPDTLRDTVAGLFRAGIAEPVDDVWALRNVSFEVPRGDVVGVIGRNGAGKSTLLKILSRVTAPTEGGAVIRGRIGSLLEVGTGFHPELTGRENIYLSGAVLGMRAAEIRRKFDDIVDFAETDRFLDTPVKHYSSGMYVRLAFSVAAHLQPEVLLVDEVLAVGDVDFQRKCVGKIGQVAEHGRTVLVVSHSMSTIKALCSRAMLLDGGMLAALGPADAIVDRYLAGARAHGAERGVAESDHVGETRRLRVVSVHLANAEGDRFAVTWRQPIVLRVDVEAREAIGEVTFGACVRLLDGSPVFTVHHEDDPALRPWDFAPGRYSIRVTLRNELRPGLYRLELGASRRYYGPGHLFAVEAATLEVLDFSASGATPNPAQPGIVNGCAAWEAPVESSQPV